MLPALWAVGHYLYFWLSGQLQSKSHVRENLLDTPVKMIERKKRAWSWRETIGRVLLTIVLALLTLFFVLIVVAGVLSLL